MRPFLSGGLAAIVVAMLFTACGDSARNNEGACVAQTAVDPASGCDTAKSSYYTCPGAAKPAIDGGTCTFSKVQGGFCCPLPTQAGNGTQTGQIVDLTSPTTGISGATIDFGNGISTTSDASGKYSLQITQNTPYSMTVTADSYTILQEQEWFLTGDYNAKTTSIVSASLNAIVSGGLPGYDNAKVALGLGVYYNDGVNYTQGGCKDNGGAVIAVDPPTAGKLVYFNTGHTPVGSATSVQTGAINPSALLYNIDPSAPLPTITVTPPASCTVAPYPLQVGNVTYTGKYKLLASGVNGQAFFRTFLN